LFFKQVNKRKTNKQTKKKRNKVGVLEKKVNKHLKRKDRAFTLMLETLSLVLNCSVERNLQR